MKSKSSVFTTPERVVKLSPQETQHLPVTVTADESVKLNETMFLLVTNGKTHSKRVEKMGDYNRNESRS
jgi:hypothetical protein